MIGSNLNLKIKVNKVSQKNTNPSTYWLKLRDYMAWSCIHCGNWFSIYWNSDSDL